MAGLAGVGDGLLVIDGKLQSSNCDCLGYARPAALLLNGTASDVRVMSRAEPAPPGTLNALAAGPNLVSVGDGGEPVVDIPWDDFNVNIWEHSANTAAGLVRHGCSNPRDGSTCASVSLALVTADGYDGCPHSDSRCGTNAHHMAYFMKDYVGATVAMEMDQGGSTTMYVAGEGDQGIVSNPGRGVRAVFDALFVMSRT